MLEVVAMPEELSAERIVLSKRQHVHDEAIWLGIDHNRDFLRRYLFWVDGTRSVSDVINATDIFLKKWAKQDNFAYVILDEFSGALLGSIDLQKIDMGNHSAQIGYWLRKDKTGFGYVSSALKLIEAEAFKNGIHRLEIRCDSENISSSAVAKRNGYKFEAILHQAINNYGAFHDEEIYVKFNPRNK